MKNENAMWDKDFDDVFKEIGFEFEMDFEADSDEEISTGWDIEYD